MFTRLISILIWLLVASIPLLALSHSHGAHQIETFKPGQFLFGVLECVFGFWLGWWWSIKMLERPGADGRALSYSLAAFLGGGTIFFHGALMLASAIE